VLDGLEDAAHDALDQGGEDRALVREVLVQRTPRDVRLSADDGDGRLMEALAREDRERAVEDLVTARIGAKPCSVPGSRHVVLGSPWAARPQELSSGMVASVQAVPMRLRLSSGKRPLETPEDSAAARGALYVARDRTGSGMLSPVLLAASGWPVLGV
jgi:hypothetical protein